MFLDRYAAPYKQMQSLRSKSRYSFIMQKWISIPAMGDGYEIWPIPEPTAADSTKGSRPVVSILQAFGISDQLSVTYQEERIDVANATDALQTGTEKPCLEHGDDETT